MRRLLYLLATILAVMLLSGCGGQQSGTATATPPPQFTALHVLRTSIIAANHIRPFETTSTRVADIEHLYAAIQRLRLFPDSYGASCSLDQGVDYELTFLDGSHSVFRAAVPTGGCARVVLENGHVLQVQTATFWTTFESATGMSASMVWDTTPSPQPPYAPKPMIPTFLWGFKSTPQPTATSQT